MSVTTGGCHCGHPFSQHRISAYGQTCAVPCGGRKDYGTGIEDCYCVRSMAFADVPADVQPFPGQRPHPQLAARLGSAVVGEGNQ